MNNFKHKDGEPEIEDLMVLLRRGKEGYVNVKTPAGNDASMLLTLRKSSVPGQVLMELDSHRGGFSFSEAGQTYFSELGYRCGSYVIGVDSLKESVETHLVELLEELRLADISCFKDEQYERKF